MPAYVPAAARTVNLLEAFAQQRRELSNAEIAKLLGMAESSCSDLLHTLHECGWLMRTAMSRRFYPTSRLMSVATQIAANDPLVAAGQEACDLLGERTGETAICGVLSGHHVDVVGIREGRYELRYITAVGTRVALHVSAMGKALLAALSPAEAQRILDDKPLRAVTATSVVDPAVLRRQLREARRRGYAQTDGEGTDGVGALAIAGSLGDRWLAVSLAGPADRLRKHRAMYAAELLEIKAQVFGAAVETV